MNMCHHHLWRSLLGCHVGCCILCALVWFGILCTGLNAVLSCHYLNTDWIVMLLLKNSSSFYPTLSCYTVSGCVVHITKKANRLSLAFVANIRYFIFFIPCIFSLSHNSLTNQFSGYMFVKTRYYPPYLCRNLY